MSLPEAPDLTGAADVVADTGSVWLKQVWQRAEVRRAVGVASPVLSRQIDEAVLADCIPEVRQIRRLVRSLASYLLRWQGRATPFGMFAGVATAGVGAEAVVQWGERHRAVAGADAHWLAAVVNTLERQPALLERLPVVANTVALVRGGRLVVPGRPPGERPDALAPLEVSLRHTPPVRMAMEAACRPVPFGELCVRLASAYPIVSQERVCALLAALVAQGFLITSLRAPMSVPDALRHVHMQLAAVNAAELPDVAGTTRELGAIHREISRHNDTLDSAMAQRIRAALAERMGKISDAAPQPLTIDTVLDCHIDLPQRVIHEAQAAASALLRLTPYPFGYPRWKDFHVRFRRHYGVGAVVPVRDLVADSGLGFPADYLGSPTADSGARTLTDRDETLLALVQHSVMDGREEIVLTEQLIRSLTVGDPTEVLPPPRVELAFQIHALSVSAIDDGTFRLVVTATPRPGSSMAGRFADLLTDTGRKALTDAYACVSTDARDVVAAQLSFPPRRRRSENVTRTPRLLSQVVSLGEYRDAGADGDVIDLQDLAVTADVRQLHLVQLSTGRRIEPRVLHALEAGTLTPPLARFLAEVTNARSGVYRAFDWGAAVRLPYLPRLRYGRSVLAPARWLLTASELPPRKASSDEWNAAFEAWRGRLRVPGSVVLCETDLRLPLDLGRPLLRALLRARLDRVREVELQEASAPDSVAWFGRPHEVLVQMRFAGPRPTAQQAKFVPSLRIVERDAGHLPGRSRWLYAQVYGHPGRQGEILTDHLPGLVNRWADLRLWWFRRHRDTTRPDSEQYLALYVLLPEAAHYGEAADRVGEWAAGLRDGGLLREIRLDTYHPEVGRYGHGEAMAAAETVFGADSAAAIAELTLVINNGLPAEAVTAASLLDLASSYSTSPTAAHQWLIGHLPYERGPLDRNLRDTALRLADTRSQEETLGAIAGGEAVAHAWERRRTALRAYRVQFGRQRDDPDSVLRSLLHLHHARVLGVTPDRERVTHRLARTAALRQIALARRESR
jgi:thiopeptide-type bacteriocin biosynthesis protein